MSGTTVLPRGVPFDTAAWLPSDAILEVRMAAGRLHGALAVRKLAAAPSEAVKRLRRLHGDTGVISAETRNVVRGVPAEPFNRRAHGSHLRGDTERGAWRAGGTPSNPPAKTS